MGQKHILQKSKNKTGKKPKHPKPPTLCRIWPHILSGEYAKCKLHRERITLVKWDTYYMPETLRNIFRKRVKMD